MISRRIYIFPFRRKTCGLYMPHTDEPDGIPDFMAKIERCGGRIAAAPPDKQAEVLETQVREFSPGQQEFARAQLGLLVAKLNSERGTAMKPLDIFKVLGLSIVFLAILI